jgi:predicted Zn-dependent peptidase
LIGEIATVPAFNAAELDKLKKRELARLELRAQSPHFLAARELHKALYGAHPYAHVDTTKEVVSQVRRDDLLTFHRTHFAPNNAFLITTGAVTHERVQASAERAFQNWTKRPVPVLKYPTPVVRNQRDVIIVDRRPSVQSVIYHGNLALPRVSEDFIPLMVANQVLGGSAAARLFMDLREKRSLTYGAYSRLEERAQIAPFTAYASVRTEVTGDAMAAFEEHLRRIVREAPRDDELVAAKHYLIDRFPLRIETADKIADLVADLRMYGLPDDYWDHFGASIEAVTPAQALAAAQKYIRPAQSVIVVVGEAAQIRPALVAYGPVTVVDTNGRLVLKARSAPGPTPTSSPEAPAAPSSSTPPVPGATGAPNIKEH